MEEEKKENMENVDGMPENNGTEQGAAAQTEEGSSATEKLGKFKSVDALLRAYNSLQAEFTRRSQRLKELEREREEGNIPPSAAEPVTPPAAKASAPSAPSAAAPEREEEELYRRANASEEVRKRIIGEYLDGVKKNAVPLMSGGVSVVSPAAKAKNLAEAGAMALGYFRDHH